MPTPQINSDPLLPPSASPSDHELVPENRTTTSINQSSQATPQTDSETQINGGHTVDTTGIEEEEQWHATPITFQPPPTPRTLSISRFPNLARGSAQMRSEILLSDEDSSTLGAQETFRLASTTETEYEQPPAIPPRPLRRLQRRSPSLESELSISEMTGGRRGNRVDYIGSQGLNRVNGPSHVPQPPPNLVSSPRRRDATIGVEDGDVNSFPLPPSGTVPGSRERATESDLLRDFWARGLAAQREREGRPELSFLRPVGNSLMVVVGGEEDEDEDENGVFAGFEDGFEDTAEETEISISSSLQEREDEDLREEVQDYNFTPQRRQRLMQQMARDIHQYTTYREEEFGRDHGYQLYPSDVAPPERLPLRSPSLDPLGIHEASTSPPRLRRSAFTSPNLREIVTSQDPLTSNSSAIPNSSRPFPVPLRNGGRATRATPLTSLTPDHTQDFGRYLYTAYRNTEPETNDLPMEQLLGSGNLSFFSFAHSQPPSFRDINAYEREADTLQPDILWRIMNRAIDDGLDQREGTEFIRHWNNYLSNFQAPYPQLPDMIPLLHLQFVHGFRLGWGSWSPSRPFLCRIRRLLVRESTRFPHIPWDGIPTGPDDPRTSALDWITRMRSVPFGERRRMLRLAEEGPDIHRIVGIWQTWLMQGTVGNSGMPEESGFSSQQLRMDRLERIIREERNLNENLGARGAVVRSLDVLDSSEDEDEGALDGVD